MPKLDPQQREAVDYRGGNLLILAGAGSGKTNTLAHRAASLLHETGPGRMMIVTFTKKAANEIHERIVRLRGGTEAGVEGIWLGTFHSICRRILRNYVQHLGFEDEPTVMDPDDSLLALGRCVRNKGYDLTVLSQFYSYLKNSELTVEELLSKKRFKLDIDPVSLKKIFHLYETRCRQSNRVDFDAILWLTRDLLERYPQVRQELRDQFEAILVDEYQDTNKVQESILAHLNTGKNITVVGDDSQSIYEFRAADVQNIIRFQDKFNAKTINIELNYRNTPQIVAIANAAIMKNKSRLDKTNRASRPDGPMPEVHALPTQQMEAERVVALVKQHREEKSCKLREMAVLYRSGGDKYLAHLLAVLKREKIPYVIYGGKDFYALWHVKAVLDFLRLLTNQKDIIALENLACLYDGASESLDSTTDVSEPLHSEELWRRLAARAQYGDKGASSLLQIKVLIDRIKTEHVPGESILEHLRKVVHFLRPVINERSETPKEKIDEDMNILVSVAAAYTSFTDFVNTITLQQTNDSDEESLEDYITLTTVHSAKGLEWNIVFITCMVSWIFPLQWMIQALGNDEEERRLFYVAITRARNHLYLSHFGSSFDVEKNKDIRRHVSHFITDLPANLYVLKTASAN